MMERRCTSVTVLLADRCGTCILRGVASACDSATIYCGIIMT
jgi:hypothetical protein